jgi:hypothetical protein
MSDENERFPDPQSPDETRTQWVPADSPPAEPPPAPEEPGGWFPPAPAEEPRWANWDQPWNPADEPFDQAAVGQPPVGDFVPAPVPSSAGEAPDGDAGRGYAGVGDSMGAHPAEGYAGGGYSGGSYAGGSSSSDAPAGTAQPSDSAAGNAGSWANLHALRALAQVACPILLLVGLSFSEDGVQSGWEAYPAWAVFALVCAVIQLAPLVGRSLGLTAENAWFLAAVGTAGLVGYWVIIVLPGVSSNTGFAQTLAAGFAAIGLWLSPGRRV